MENLILREMHEEDADSVAVIYRKCFGKHGGPRRKYFTNAADNWRYEYMVAELDGKIVACMGAKLAEWYEDYYEAKKNRAEIEVVVVDPDYHNLGIGTKLFGELIAKLDKMNVTAMHLCVHPGNTPAIQFYEHFGFKYLGFIGRQDELEQEAHMTRFKWERELFSEE